MAIVGEAPTRAGRYITQPTGDRAFMPAPLPPQPALALGGELQGLLSAADKGIQELVALQKKALGDFELKKPK